MNPPPDALLRAAADWATDTVKDSYDPTLTGRLLNGWVEVLRSAETAWEQIPAPGRLSDIATGNPFRQAALTAASIQQDLPHQVFGDAIDPRAGHVSNLLSQTAQAVPEQLDADALSFDPRRAAGWRAGVLHVGYLVTHAAATSAERHAVHVKHTDPDLTSAMHAISTRIYGVEQLLDAHLHRRPHPAGGPPSQLGSLDQTLAQVLRLGYGAHSAGPATHLVLADIGRQIMGNTARLSIAAVQQGWARPQDVRDRLLPALETAARQWEETREIWVRLLPPAERPAKDAAALANQLQRAFQDPEAARHPAVASSLTAALAVASELSLVNQSAITNPGLVAPAGAVAKLTHEALVGESESERIRTWQNMPRAEGTEPTPLPPILETKLALQAQSNVYANQTARSAGNVLADRTGYHPLFELHQGKPNPTRRHPDPPTRPTTPSSPRIG